MSGTFEEYIRYQVDCMSGYVIERGVDFNDPSGFNSVCLEWIEEFAGEFRKKWNLEYSSGNYNARKNNES